MTNWNPPSAFALRATADRSADLPDGRARWFSCPAPFAKIFPFPPDPNHFYIPRRPAPLEGRIAIVTDAGWDAVDVGGAADESADLRTVKSCGPGASTPAASLREQAQATETRKPDLRGEREGNR